MTRLIIAILQDRTVHPLCYVLRAWPIAMAPTLLVATAAFGFARLTGAEFLFDESQWGNLVRLPPWLLLVQVVFVAPVLETLLMAPLLAGLGRLLRQRRWVVLASALLWAGLHALSAPIWGICIFWTFVVFSTAFVVWRPVSFRHAFGVTAAIHALNNAAAGVGLLLS